MIADQRTAAQDDAFKKSLVMIEITTGDLFESGAEALVNPVNCVGTMGRGLALEFKKRFPDNFGAYRWECLQCRLKPGKLYIHSYGPDAVPRFIINFPTKRHWRSQSRLGDIDIGCFKLRDALFNLNIKSVAIPALGCGLGGLKWSEVRACIEDVLLPFLKSVRDVRVLLFEPQCLLPRSRRPENDPK